jgi:hypothetical protein
LRIQHIFRWPRSNRSNHRPFEQELEHCFLQEIDLIQIALSIGQACTDEHLIRECSGTRCKGAARRVRMSWTDCSMICSTQKSDFLKSRTFS